MKYTGLAVILIGVFILMYSLIAALTTSQPAGHGGDVASTKMDLLLPIVMGVVALAIGVAMYLFGGRGYISTRNPAVRN